MQHHPVLGASWDDEQRLTHGIRGVYRLPDLGGTW